MPTTCASPPRWSSSVEVAAIEPQQQLLVATATLLDQRGGGAQVVRIERLEQHEQALVGSFVEQGDELRALDQPHDQQDPACAVRPRLEHLVRVDEKILAHGRHAARREGVGRDAQVLEPAVEPRRLRQDRADRGAAFGVASQARDGIGGVGREVTERR